MDMKNAYEWGKIFAAEWDELARRMGNEPPSWDLPKRW